MEYDYKRLVGSDQFSVTFFSLFYKEQHTERILGLLDNSAPSISKYNIVDVLLTNKIKWSLAFHCWLLNNSPCDGVKLP